MRILHWLENSNFKGTLNFGRIPLIHRRAHELTLHFWSNLKVSGHELQISLGLEMEGAVVPVTMVFRHQMGRGSGNEGVRR